MKRVVLTGASDGLGRAFGMECVKNGVDVVALCRKQPDYECVFLSTDLTSKESMKASCKRIINEFSEFDALINCAGVQKVQDTGNINYDKIDELFRVNTLAPIFLTSELFGCIKQFNSDILNVGSTCGTKAGYHGEVAYTTSKWGLRGTSYTLQAELKATGCRVIQFNPGGMNTRIKAKDTGIEVSDPENWMTPDDIAKIMFYILSLPKQIEVSEITINRKVAVQLLLQIIISVSDDGVDLFQVVEIGDVIHRTLSGVVWNLF